MEYKRIGDLCSIEKRSVHPQTGETYTLFSLPAFDNARSPETVDGEDIKSSKLVLTDNTILFNKLNVQFKRVWNIHKLYTHNNVCSTEFLPLKVSGKIVSQDYLYYLLIGDELTQNMYGARRGTSGSQQRISPENLLDYEVPIYPLETQEKIAGVLRDLDDKIDLNTQINKKLESLAQSFYVSWFVDFSVFEGVEPTDWEEIVLGNIASIVTTSFRPERNTGRMVEHYSIPAFDANHFPVFELADNIKSNKYRLTKDSVMISKLNPDTKRVWRPLCLSDCPVCSTEFIVYEANNKKNKDFLYAILDSENFSKFLCSNVTGSTGSRQRAIPKTTLNYPIKMPSQSIIDSFCEIVTPIYEMIALNEIEKQKLAETRDLLLPKLIAGEIDLSDLA